MFPTVYDAVSDLGCDPTGEESCESAIVDAVDEGVLVEFPPGEYLVTEPILLREAVRFGVRGKGDDMGDVRFVHPDGYSRRLFNIRDGEGCLFENFTADQSPDRETNSGFTILQRRRVVVRDVEVAGFSPTDEAGTKDMIIQVTEPDGTGVVERYINTGGGEVGVYPAAHSGLYSGRQHRGTLQLVDCRLEECGSNGVYASKTYGPVQISGGLFRNNAVSQIRICGEGSFVRNARIVIDTESATRTEGTYNAVRGIWWESGWQQKTGGMITDCQFVVDSAQLRRGLLEIDGTAGGMTLRNSQFEVNRDGFWTVVVSPPGVSSMGGKPERPWALSVEDVRITGTASDGVDVHIDGRPRSNIEGLTIDQDGGTNRDGLCLSNSHDTTLTDTSISVSRFPLWLYRDKQREDGDCLLTFDDSLDFRTALRSNGNFNDVREIFETETIDNPENETCIPHPLGEPDSVSAIRFENGTLYGHALDSKPEYLWFPRRHQ